MGMLTKQLATERQVLCCSYLLKVLTLPGGEAHISQFRLCLTGTEVCQVQCLMLVKRAANCFIHMDVK